MEYKDFEKALARLESIVGELETGELALEEALKLFEEGVKISRFCNTKLDEAERKVEILLKNKQEQLTEETFQPEGEQKT
ncbi:exodeoxyribonuclease VII small subunit [Acidobacteria bacterium AH-259-D05]|nr:exodeoxyribonuclease VII small subunit [Acidobacteria bacterium AH-259-D05]